MTNVFTYTSFFTKKTKVTLKVLKYSLFINVISEKEIELSGDRWRV